MSLRKSFVVAISSLVVLLACAESHAMLVQWTLHNVKFNDGGTASGFFIVDTVKGDLAVEPSPDSPVGTGFDIKVTAGSLFPAGEFVPLFTGGGFFPEYGVDKHSFHHIFGGFEYSSELRLVTDADLLHDTRGTFQVLNRGFGPSFPELPLQCVPFDSRCSEESDLSLFFQSCDQHTLNGCSIFRMVSGGALTAAAVPEPSSLVLMVAGFGLIGSHLQRRSRSR
jgi:hypothetical protein